jgi:biopolymer transport protein ExbD
MKPFLRRSAQIPGIDITPLMDIVFQLLIFFVMTSALLQSALPLELPGSPADHDPVEAELIISVDREGAVFLNDSPASLEAVEEVLRSLAAEKPQAPVLLRGDKQLDYGRFFTVLDRVRGTGILTINLAYEEYEEQER